MNARDGSAGTVKPDRSLVTEGPGDGATRGNAVVTNGLLHEKVLARLAGVQKTR
ncbi:hypothetical protein [Micromonospora terminaliae]|uniref:hypothetical protein n=1 Tax=Micromonospora terminaliae TaxID=1914461 RepID=UPI001952C006|nr:hypothetical protein [Micromonospora terminaliae]